MNNQKLKSQVCDYWNQASCGTEVTNEEKFTPAYFEQIEDFRYTIEPEIFSFAQFTRFRGKKVLEVGVGAGSDFTQWVRAGAHATGIDLTQEALDNTRHRLRLQGLEPEELRVADAENLPFDDNTFDLTYSWGVIHHSPDTQRCLQEIIRVTKPGGQIRVMIYNRRSLFAYYRYLLAALFKGKPFQSLSKVLFNHQESVGTKAYTFKQVRAMFKNQPVQDLKISAPVTNHDLLYYKSKPFQMLARFAASLLGWQRSGWFMMLACRKCVSSEQTSQDSQ